jgi:hypothetical protein
MTHGPTVIVQRPNALFGGIMVVEKQLCLSMHNKKKKKKKKKPKTQELTAMP